ncbi:unnamed protein product [Protopolystoma xenopodis]|uniref:Uncharacterized protein n=1 Tax=Protopolystoma xenopodis TaxID=117903 RepID=A0A448XA39_9PLAT|nr:unnamed protein product [Protopolystoma xenopodis]
MSHVAITQSVDCTRSPTGGAEGTARSEPSCPGGQRSVSWSDSLSITLWDHGLGRVGPTDYIGYWNAGFNLYAKDDKREHGADDQMQGNENN